MSGPAARTGDLTAHGGVIVEGDATVLVQNMPAARMGDNHTCPVAAVPPHVGGPIIQGRAMVLVGNLPAATAGDAVACNGPPDTIANGCGTVLIGDDVPSGEGTSRQGSGDAGSEAGEGSAETVRFEYRLLDRDMPVSNASCRLFVDDQELSATSDGDGLIAVDIPANATTAYLLVTAEEPKAAGAPADPQAGEARRPCWINAGGDYRRPAGESGAEQEDILEIPIVLGRLEPLDPAAAPDDKSNVAAAKQRLAQLGFMEHGVPSHFSAALMDFQIYKGLPPTGMLDPKTCQALDSFEAEQDDKPLANI